jgi:hypothetical protein
MSTWGELLISSLREFLATLAVTAAWIRVCVCRTQGLAVPAETVAPVARRD